MEVLLSFHVKDIGVEGLSQIALPLDDDSQSFHTLIKRMHADEGFYLATCNRVEFLFVFSSEPKLAEFHFHGFTPRIFTDRSEILTHLLEVALSKDSVVFGESQILGQFKRAYEQGLRHKTLSRRLSPMLNIVVRDAKAIRTRVGLTQCHTSVATVAGHKVLSFVKPNRVLFIGAGETNLILARYLTKRHKAQFFWMSRTLERSQAAARECGGETLEWTWLEKLPQADVICVATHSQDVIVGSMVLDSVQPQLVCDLAVPPNASSSDCSDRGITYYGIDELNHELSQSQTISKALLEKLDAEIQSSCQSIMAELLVRELKYENMESRNSRQ